MDRLQTSSSGAPRSVLRRQPLTSTPQNRWAKAFMKICHKNGHLAGQYDETVNVAKCIEKELVSGDPTPEMKEAKKEKAVRIVQSLGNKKLAERKAAIEIIKRRQEDAKLKHEKARIKAGRIAEAKKQLKALGNKDIKIADVMALVREENKDIEEAAAGGGIAAELTSVGGAVKRQEARHSESVLRAAASRALSPAQDTQRSVIAEEVEKIPPSPEENILNPEEVAMVMLIPEIVVHPPTNTSTEVAEQQLAIILEHYQTPNIATPEWPAVALTAVDSKNGDLAKSYALFFGGEKEMSLYMKEMDDKLKELLEEVTADSLLLDESEIGAPEEFVRGLDDQRAAVEEYRELMSRPSVTRVQLRGSRPPPWFPGYFTVLPQSAPPRFQLSHSPSRCLASAWRECQPDEHAVTESILK